MILGRDQIGLTVYWHSDCRLEQELPDNNIVRTSFLANALFGTAALTALLLCGWLAYGCLILRSQIHDWDRRIADHEGEVREIQRMQHEYVNEAGKIDQAYGIIRPNLFLSDFLAQLGKTLPPQMVIDAVSYNETGLVVRGTVRESSEKATLLLGTYVDALGKRGKNISRFREIVLTNLDRAKGEELMNFELTFRLLPLPPL